MKNRVFLEVTVATHYGWTRFFTYIYSYMAACGPVQFILSNLPPYNPGVTVFLTPIFVCTDLFFCQESFFSSSSSIFPPFTLFHSQDEVTVSVSDILSIFPLHAGRMNQIMSEGCQILVGAREGCYICQMSRLLTIIVDKIDFLFPFCFSMKSPCRSPSVERYAFMQVYRFYRPRTKLVGESVMESVFPIGRIHFGTG